MASFVLYFFFSLIYFSLLSGPLYMYIYIYISCLFLNSFALTLSHNTMSNFPCYLSIFSSYSAYFIYLLDNRKAVIPSWLGRTLTYIRLSSSAEEMPFGAFSCLYIYVYIYTIWWLGGGLFELKVNVHVSLRVLVLAHLPGYVCLSISDLAAFAQVFFYLLIHLIYYAVLVCNH